MALEVSFSSTLKKNLLVCEQVGYKSWKCKGGGKGGGGECVNTNLYIYIERERESFPTPQVVLLELDAQNACCM